MPDTIDKDGATSQGDSTSQSSTPQGDSQTPSKNEPAPKTFTQEEVDALIKESPKESHAITRGSAYYSKGGGCK